MKSFADWLKANTNIKMPEGSVSASWFYERGLPMVVECKCCGMTMALPSAFIDEDGNIYCSSCKGDG